MKAAIMLVFLTGCATVSDTYCKAGYAHTYSYNSGWKQIWSADGNGVPCVVGK